MLGANFGELLKVVTEAKNKSDKYETELAKLKSTLESIKPIIQEIETSNIALNIPEQEIAKLKDELIKGMELVRKCSEVKCCCFKRVNYSDDLTKLNQSIERICEVDKLTQLIRDNKKILMKVEMQTELIRDNKKILEQVEERGVNMQTDNKKILEKVEEIGFNIQTELITDNKKILEQVEEIGVNLQTELMTDNKKILEQVDMQTELIRDNKKILEQVEEIRKKIDRDVGDRVEFDGPCLVPDPPEITPGLDAPLKELRTELVKDEGMQVIVVSAPGGAGKTTLVKKLCADNEIKDKFRENIFFVTVSKTPDVKIIVQRIFQHMKREVPTFQTDEAAINDLEQLLKSIGQKAILLVLDDVWSESLVQKFKFNLPNYKILVTSRYVFPRFGPGHKLEPLDDEGAMILFRSSVTPEDGEPYFFDENLAKKILRVCKGSPLALTVVGRLLRGEPAAVWQNTVKEWDRGKSIFVSGSELLICLQSSLDALDAEVKECYLDLGSFPQDQRIPITALIDMWMELHEWVEDGLSAITYLHKLSDRCLVNLVIARKNGSDDGCYNDDFIMLHDLLRDLIIHQSMSERVEQTKRLIIDINGNKFPKWWSEQKQNPIHARLLSISTELLKVVTHVISKSIKFKSELEKLKSTLKSITPVIQEIEMLNIALNISVQETAMLKEELNKGMELVRKCSKVKCSCFGRVNYADKLVKLNQFIERICRVDMLTQLIRDNKKILVKVEMQTELIKDNKEILEKVEERGVNMQTDNKNILEKVEEIGFNIQTELITDNKKILENVNATLSILRRNEKSGGNRGEIDELCSVPEPPEITPGLDASLEELRKELIKDNGMQVIVVTAPGGYGKTTLVKKLCTDDQIKDKFKENIFFVTVSKTPDVKFIVQRILQHMKKEVPTFQTEEAAINDLERFLKSIRHKAILLVLDDVWSESLVQKFKFKLPNYKILVTSRSVFPQFGSGHKLKPLKDEAAMILFRSSVTPQDGKLTYFDENLANKILRVCKGSPLALTVVGKFLCGEPAAVWQSKVKEWDRGESIFISGTDLLVCLQSSLDALDDKVKECYLDLGSFPQDQWIPLTALIDMWMELHEWVEDGLSAIKYLHELSKRNLVNLVIARKHASEDHFFMHHDILRDLIVHQSMLEPIEQRKRLIIDISGNQFPKWWLEQNQNSIHARLLSISTDETFSSGWYELNAPEVEVIVLNVRTNKYALPNFMWNMGKLKVVIVSNIYGFLPAELSNFSLLGSDIVSNLKRIRLEHVSIPSFDVQMKNLQKISLFMCNVGQAFRNSNCQISDSFPNLLEFEIDYCNDLLKLPDELCDIVSLKKLNITECFKLSTLPEEIGKLVKLEELRLASCTALKELPEMVTELSKLKLLDISGCISISKLPTQIGKLCSLEMLGMRGCSSFELPQSIENLERLKLVK